MNTQALDFNRVQYARTVVEMAETLLSHSPRADLSKITRENISGGHGYWDDVTNDVYLNPQNFEEALVALDLRDVLVAATRNLLCDLLQQPRQEWDGVKSMMRLTLLFNLALKLAHRDARIAGAIKAAAHQFSVEYFHMPLLEFLTTYASRFCMYRDDPTGYM